MNLISCIFFDHTVLSIFNVDLLIEAEHWKHTLVGYPRDAIVPTKHEDSD